MGIPADLLRRRPDVRRAERQVAAQSARVGVAETDLYPRLSLNGFVGFVADDFKDLFAAKSFTGLFFPTLQWNVLSYGRVRNNIKAQDAQLQAAGYQYQQTVLNAGREVEDALVGFLQAQQQAAYLEDSVRDAQRSVELVLLQFQGGVIDFNRVYNTQTSSSRRRTNWPRPAATSRWTSFRCTKRSAGAGYAFLTDAECRASRAPAWRLRSRTPSRRTPSRRTAVPQNTVPQNTVQNSAPCPPTPSGRSSAKPLLLTSTRDGTSRPMQKASRRR